MYFLEQNVNVSLNKEVLMKKRSQERGTSTPREPQRWPPVAPSSPRLKSKTRWPTVRRTRCTVQTVVHTFSCLTLLSFTRAAQGVTEQGEHRGLRVPAPRRPGPDRCRPWTGCEGLEDRSEHNRANTSHCDDRTGGAIPHAALSGRSTAQQQWAQSKEHHTGPTRPYRRPLCRQTPSPSLWRWHSDREPCADT